MTTPGKDLEVKLPLMTAWEDGQGGIRFLGVASSTRIDRQKERMTPGALESMARSRDLLLLPHHRAAPEEALGVVERGWSDGRSFRVAGRLRGEDPRAWALVKSIQSGRSYGLSVGGRITKAFWGYAEGTEGPVRHIEEVELEHVALCGPEEAVNPDAELGKVVGGLTPWAGTSRPPVPLSETERDEESEARRESEAEGEAQAWPPELPEEETGESGEAAVLATGEAVVLATGETAVVATGETPVVPERETEGEEPAVEETKEEEPEVEEAAEEATVVPGQRRSLPKDQISTRRREAGATQTKDNLWRGVL